MDAAAADDAVARVLIARGNRVLGELRQEGHKEGRLTQARDTLLAILAARGLPPADAQREHILLCQDLARLLQWTTRAATAPA